MKINILKLEQSFEKFKLFIKEVSGQEFTSFDNKYIDEQENYKKIIYNNAIEILGIESWKAEDIGTGKIIELLSQAIDQKHNNLLVHDNRRGEDARQDKVLIKARKDKDLAIKLEKILFDFYKSNVSDEESFNNIVELSGKIYPFLAFLFFIKSNRKYLPLAPETFDEIFEELNIDFKTSHKCSWDNYIGFIEILKEVRSYIISREEVRDEVDLLDAHSFLWILAKQMKKQVSEKKEEQRAFVLVEVKATKRMIKSNEYSSEPTIKNQEDFEKENQRKWIKGRESEEIVFNFEVANLISAGKKDLADKVEIKSNQIGLGYDILSFDLDGKEKHIEVKTDSGKSFWLTKNELKISESDKNYHIYIVDKKNFKIEKLTFNKLIEDCNLVAEVYRVYF